MASMTPLDLQKKKKKKKKAEVVLVFGIWIKKRKRKEGRRGAIPPPRVESCWCAPKRNLHLY